MKYCIPYYRNSKYKDTIDEVSVLATEKDELLGIQNFLKTRDPIQRVFFTFRNIFYHLTDVDFTLLAAVLKDKNYTICWQEANLDDMDCAYIAETCKQYGLNFCFSKIAYAADVLRGMSELGVSDVYISGDLGFDMPTVRRVKRKYSVLIRAYPDICQSEWRSLSPEYTFWIRPEDQDAYSEIDVLQTWMGVKGQIYADVWYQVYGIEKKWLGDLTKLISGLFIDRDSRNIDSRCFTEHFAEQRRKCARECLKTSQCVFCKEAVLMAQNIRGLGYTIQDPQDEHGILYYKIMEELDKEQKEQRAEIDAEVKRVLGEFYDNAR